MVCVVNNEQLILVIARYQFLAGQNISDLYNLDRLYISNEGHYIISDKPKI